MHTATTRSDVLARPPMMGAAFFRRVRLANVEWREGTERSRGVYVVGNVDPLNRSQVSCRNLKKCQRPIADYPRWNLENKSASPLDMLEIDGCLARGFWADNNYPTINFNQRTKSYDLRILMHPRCILHQHTS
ncbi:hypothetical protein K443DRAFT_674625 [Laccaria amethystina LaAM-08-1]|uniref:Uncharacterized protein n=1 Tax=Laccaria amethystina LaAM-08-1 TaxID=1095629 RepID=A0A0C9XWU2_9AGAR|nr:hypothetical protein K443DRAFT_674625 [Laccaria amethystina LaAM-08-1]